MEQIRQQHDEHYSTDTKNIHKDAASVASVFHGDITTIMSLAVDEPQRPPCQGLN